MLAGCTPTVRPAGSAIGAPIVAPSAVVMADGARLPYAAWLPASPPQAVVLALHGFGDYSRNAFDLSAALFTAAGVALYAYDQRGFGAAPHPGIWAGTDTLVADLAAVVGMLRERHPGTPLYLLGESMGAAVILTAGVRAGFPPVDGAILVAPGVRGRASMSGFSRGVLEVASRAIPLVGFQGGAPGYVASNNAAALERFGRDPLTLKVFRVDLVYGVVGLMDAALAAAPHFGPPLLVLSGGRDMIVPQAAIRRLVAALPRCRGRKVAFYPEGYHLLLRDAERATVVADVLAWMADRRAPLPSGADAVAARWLAGGPDAGCRRDGLSVEGDG